MVPLPTETTPLPVEITNHTDWWVQWLPLAGSLVVALVAFIGVVLTNRGSDKRELTKWRRETIMKLSADVVGGASEIQRSCIAAVERNNETYSQDLRVADDERRRLFPVGSAIEIVGASTLAKMCKGLIDECFNLVQHTKELREADERYEEAKKVPEDSPARDQNLVKLNATYKSAESAWLRSARTFAVQIDIFSESAMHEIKRTGQGRWYRR